MNRDDQEAVQSLIHEFRQTLANVSAAEFENLAKRQYIAKIERNRKLSIAASVVTLPTIIVIFFIPAVFIWLGYHFGRKKRIAIEAVRQYAEELRECEHI